jgi:RNA polymerase sigma-70 factor (ECF subfamily)
VTEEGLIRRAAGGDARAFEVLAARHRPSALRIARTLLGDDDAAEDVAQELLIRLAAALPAFRGDAELSTWAYRVTLNLVRDHLRRVRRRASEVDVDQLRHAPGLTVEPSPDRDVDSERARSAVRAALETLPADQKEAIMLRYAADLSYKEIARMTDTPQGTVASRVFRALKRLGQEVEPLHLEVLP